tara:strand:- start:13 stop:123 length:111 start_codon:yes stop_codon:yes gene_type:complete
MAKVMLMMMMRMTERELSNFVLENENEMEGQEDTRY